MTEDDCDTLESYFETEYPDGINLTELNDIMRFEDDLIAELLGYDDWESLLRDRNGEEEEDDESEYPFDEIDVDETA